MQIVLILDIEDVPDDSVPRRPEGRLVAHVAAGVRPGVRLVRRCDMHRGDHDRAVHDGQELVDEVEASGNHAAGDSRVGADVHITGISVLHVRHGRRRARVAVRQKAGHGQAVRIERLDLP